MVAFRKLCDVSSIVMGQSPKGDTYNNDNIGMPLLNGPTEFGSNNPIPVLFTTDSKRECDKGALIFCVRGSTTGRMNWADQKYSLGRGVCSFKGDDEYATRFIRYCIEVNLEALLKLAGGGTFPSLTKDTIHNFEIPFPDNYKKTSKIVVAYDNLIENNNRRIAILEDMAQSLYKEWFVKFRFPGYQKTKFKESSLGLIPEGWVVSELGEFIDFWNGKKCTKSDSGEFPIYGANGIIGMSDEPKYENGIVIGRVGAYCGAVEYCFNKFWGSDNTIIVKCKSEENLSYLFLLLKFFNLNSFAGGSAQPLLTQATLKKLSFILPSLDIIEKFDAIILTVYRGIDSLVKKNKNLKRQRDLLLPKLISVNIKIN